MEEWNNGRRLKSSGVIAQGTVHRPQDESEKGDGRRET
jgi:hypothetical protein